MFVFTCVSESSDDKATKAIYASITRLYNQIGLATSILVLNAVAVFLFLLQCLTMSLLLLLIFYLDCLFDLFNSQNITIIQTQIKIILIFIIMISIYLFLLLIFFIILILYLLIAFILMLVYMLLNRKKLKKK